MSDIYESTNDSFSRGAKTVSSYLTGMLKNKLGRLGMFVLKAILKAVIAFLAPVAGWLIIALLCFVFVYGLIFIVPAEVIKADREAGIGTAVSIFYAGDEYGWTREDDMRLHRKYLELADRVKKPAEKVRKVDGLYVADSVIEDVESQIAMAEPHRVPWGIMAAIDRFLGDPAMTGSSFWAPDPERTYEALKPEMHWKKSIIRTTVEVTWKEVVQQPDGSFVTVTRTETDVEEEEVYLLKKVYAYDATYDYRYKDVTEKWTEDRGGRHYSYEVEKEVLENYERYGPYFERVYDFLAENGIKGDDVELIFHLATIYDETLAGDLIALGAYSGAADKPDLSIRYWEGSPGSLKWPLDASYKTITSPFGPRIHPVYGTVRFHTGVDIAVPEGKKVYAAMNGMVIFAGTLGGYGKTVIIDHGDYKTLYAHLSAVNVKDGDEVTGGSIIARSGSTGLSTGPHLHFEFIKVLEGGIKYLDPLDFY
jgi:murein DD-endopeptidase MepM/ murein hydrolase activator NlpD